MNTTKTIDDRFPGNADEAVAALRYAALQRMSNEQRARAEETLRTRKFPNPEFDALYLYGQGTLALTHASIGAILSPERGLENAVRVYVNSLLRCSGQEPLYDLNETSFFQD